MYQILLHIFVSFCFPYLFDFDLYVPADSDNAIIYVLCTLCWILLAVSRTAGAAAPAVVEMTHT